jgi:hypothetical protein
MDVAHSLSNPCSSQTAGKEGRGRRGRYAEFPPQLFVQPLDHFDKTYEGHTLKQRYWVNKRHYVPGTRGMPVGVLDGGETSGEVCSDPCVSFVRLSSPFYLIFKRCPVNSLAPTPYGLSYSYSPS